MKDLYDSDDPTGCFAKSKVDVEFEAKRLAVVRSPLLEQLEVLLCAPLALSIAIPTAIE